MTPFPNFSAIRATQEHGAIVTLPLQWPCKHQTSKAVVSLCRRDPRLGKITGICAVATPSQYYPKRRRSLQRLPKTPNGKAQKPRVYSCQPSRLSRHRNRTWRRITGPIFSVELSSDTGTETPQLRSKPGRRTSISLPGSRSGTHAQL